MTLIGSEEENEKTNQHQLAERGHYQQINCNNQLLENPKLFFPLAYMGWSPCSDHYGHCSNRENVKEIHFVNAANRNEFSQCYFQWILLLIFGQKENHHHYNHHYDQDRRKMPFDGICYYISLFLLKQQYHCSIVIKRYWPKSETEKRNLIIKKCAPVWPIAIIARFSFECVPYFNHHFYNNHLSYYHQYRRQYHQHYHYHHLHYRTHQQHLLSGLTILLRNRCTGKTNDTIKETCTKVFESIVFGLSFLNVMLFASFLLGSIASSTFCLAICSSNLYLSSHYVALVAFFLTIAIIIRQKWTRKVHKENIPFLYCKCNYSGCKINSGKSWLLLVHSWKFFVNIILGDKCNDKKNQNADQTNLSRSNLKLKSKNKVQSVLKSVIKKKCFNLTVNVRLFRLIIILLLFALAKAKNLNKIDSYSVPNDLNSDNNYWQNDDFDVQHDGNGDESDDNDQTGMF